MTQDEINEAHETLQSIKMAEKYLNQLRARHAEERLEVAIASSSKAMTGYTETSNRHVFYFDVAESQRLKDALAAIVNDAIKVKRLRLAKLGVR